MELRVGGKFKIAKILGEGAFGKLYSGNNLKTGDEVAIKMERTDAKYPMLQYEASVYKKLIGNQGIPTIHWYGVEGEFNVLVMDILGPPLEDLFKFCKHHWGMKSILWVASQMISRIEVMHNSNFVHRDIKPENFLIGAGKKENMVYIIDFGLAKRYLCPKTGKHIDKNKKTRGTGINGTPRYCSLNALKGKEQSRKDDMEAIGNVILYFALDG